MKISQLIEKLRFIRRHTGDVEVTITGTVLPDGHGRSMNVPDVYETTAEDIQTVENHPTFGKHVRILP